MGEKLDIAKIVEQTTDLHIDLSIDVPRIVVVPKGEVTSGFADFDLDTSNIHLQPVEKDILIQHLHDQTQHRLVSGDGTVAEARLEDYLVRGLIDFDDISYDDHAELLYKLCGQLVAHLKTYLNDVDDIKNVLQYHQKGLVDLVHAQMQVHYSETAAAYEAHVSKGFVTLRANSYSAPAGEVPRNFRTPVEERLLIKGMLFSGFKKCLYPVQKFESDSERRFAVVLENSGPVLKWFKPSKGDFQIHYSGDDNYEPDFVVETDIHSDTTERDNRNILTKVRAWSRYFAEL